MALIGLLLTGFGCGSVSEGIVQGPVTLDGVPVATGAVTFVPMDGETATAGAMIKDGKFTATVPVGRKKVVLSAPKVVGQKKLYPTADSPVMDVTEEKLPARYNTRTELELDVKPGVNPVAYELKAE